MFDPWAKAKQYNNKNKNNNNNDFYNALSPASVGVQHTYKKILQEYRTTWKNKKHILNVKNSYQGISSVFYVQ